MRHRRPFWLPASNYYILAASVAIALFFLVWGMLNDGQEETPWIPAGIAAAIVLGTAVILRELILREARRRYLETQRTLDQSVRLARSRSDRERPKLSLERNAAILHEISRKSEAAKVLGRFSEGHREVFELCHEYLEAVTRELPTVGAGSPRIAALRRGSDVAGRYHHYHLLQWAELESKALTQQANKRDKISNKLDSVQAALSVVDFALESYPHEMTLLDSRKVLHELITSMKVTDLIEEADRTEFKGDHERALSLYQDALFLLERESRLGTDNEAILHLKEQIEKIRHLPFDR